MKHLLLIILVAVLSGCGTCKAFKYRSSDEAHTRYPRIYPAIKYDCNLYCWLFDSDNMFLRREGMANLIYVAGCIPVFVGTTVDFSISAVTDTLSLPYDIHRLKHRSDINYNSGSSTNNQEEVINVN